VAWREDRSSGKDPCRTKERGEEMLSSVTDGLLGGLLSGLEAQAEINELLEELYYDCLI
jgi:hypothetical protein